MVKIDTRHQLEDPSGIKKSLTDSDGLYILDPDRPSNTTSVAWDYQRVVRMRVIVPSAVNEEQTTKVS
jgi:hypothetical protein